MTKKNETTPKADGVPTEHLHANHIAKEAAGGASGALAGAVFGIVAGPPGIVAGAVIGGIVGAVAGAVLDEESVIEAERNTELDDQIGVNGADMGAPNLKHPPAKVGAYSSGSAGDSAGGADSTTAEGTGAMPGGDA